MNEELGQILIEIEINYNKILVEKDKSFIVIPEECNQILIDGLQSKHYKRKLSEIVELGGKRVRVFV